MIKTQICILANCLMPIGGIETFVYNWCNLMKDKYDIVVAYSHIASEQYYRLRKVVRVVENTADIECDTLLVMHVASRVIPQNIKYKRKIQMVHGCKSIAYSNIAECDLLVPVSDTAKESFGNDIKDFNVNVVHNPMYISKPNRVLKLISATRLTKEKGGQRILQLAEQLRNANIPFIWYVFSNTELINNRRKKNEFNGIVQIPPTLDITSWIKECDYLVQLSDTESFGYSIVESLMLGVPVIVTPLDVLNEIGFKEGINGYTVPFDMKDIDVYKLYNSRLKFEYKYDNQIIANKWCDILGKSKPFVKYKYVGDDIMKIKMIRNGITLTVEKKNPKKGDIVEVTEERARVICNAGYAVVVEQPIAEAKKEIKEEKKAEAKEEVVEVAMPKEKVEVAKVKKTTTRKKK